MTNRLTICQSCGIVICGTEQPQQAGLCEGCYTARAEVAREDAEAAAVHPAQHVPEFIGENGLYPAVKCSCGKFGYTFTHKEGDTEASKHHRLAAAFGEHLLEQPTQEQHHDTIPKN